MRFSLHLLAGVALFSAASPAAAALPLARHTAVAFAHRSTPVAFAHEAYRGYAHPHGLYRGARQAYAIAGGYGYGGASGMPEEGSIDATPAGAAPQAVPFCGPSAPPPQLTCFRPRLIVLGPRGKSHHLPHVTYGGPLPCGFHRV